MIKEHTFMTSTRNGGGGGGGGGGKSATCFTCLKAIDLLFIFVDGGAGASKN